MIDRNMQKRIMIELEEALRPVLERFMACVPDEEWISYRRGRTTGLQLVQLMLDERNVVEGDAKRTSPDRPDRFSR